MVNYMPILQNLPPELQVTLLQLVAAVEQNLREQLASREETVDVRALANGLLESQQSALERMDRLEIALLQLAQAQQRTEQQVAQLAQAQQRTEQQVEQLAQAQHELAQAQLRTEQRVEQLAQAQHELAQAQLRTEQRVEQLAQAQHELAQAQLRTEQGLNRLSSEVGELTRAVRAMQPKVARADGWLLEQRYIERAPSYFGRWFRQIEVLWPGRLDRKLEQQLDVALTPEEKDEVLRLDAILRGKVPPPASQDEVFVALEASVTIYVDDVERAWKRAALLRRLDIPVVAVVAGEAIERDAETYAQANAVAILQDGKRLGWEQALTAA
jgi:flagellar motor protein MotB